MKDFDEELLEFIEKHPTAYHVTEGQAKALEKAGFERLFEGDEWKLKKGGKYYCVRNSSALIAFAIPEGDWKGFSVAASHSDSPCLKIKENPEMSQDGKYTRLNAEVYGGAILATWFDRPLGIAGRVFVRDGVGLSERLVNFDRNMAIIASLAIHMNRDVNNGYKYNAQKDMIPIAALSKDFCLKDALSKECGVKAEDILGYDLFLYNREKGCFLGAGQEFMAGARLDDAACAYASLCAMLESSPSGKVAVHAVLDNEEVGSSTRQGAASTFLRNVLERIEEAFKDEGHAFKRDVAESFMLSCDNGHALHPNYPEKCDVVNQPVLGGGVVLKFSANQKYTTDGGTAAKVRLLAEKAGAKLQVFTNRSDIPGGSTLGNISANQAAIAAADVGLAQLAMHSSYECCGRGDAAELKKLIGALLSE